MAFAGAACADAATEPLTNAAEQTKMETQRIRTLQYSGYTLAHPPSLAASPVYLDTDGAGKVPEAGGLRLIYSRIMADEQGITSDESAVAEPEIEADKSPAAETGIEPDENAEAKGDSVEAGCSILMGYSDTRVRCGRRLHVAPEGADEKPVCLMHSKDPHKQSGPLFDEFWQEFERILEYADEGEAHFERFVFPQIDLAWGVFQAFCLFAGACFTQRVDFRFATFTKEADFFKATFAKDADFLHATFTRNADFREATFTEGVSFNRAFFAQGATFWSAIFKESASFRETTFTQYTDFSKATFKQDTDFSNASFEGYVYFSGVAFTQGADFTSATLAQDSDFSSATFALAANFVDTKFHGTADWQGSRFIDQAKFRRTKFDPQVAGRPSAVFALASFSKPGEIVFEDVDLSRALFHNCDVSQVLFTPSVTWGKRESNRGLAVFEETISLEHLHAKGLQRNGQRDYRAVAQVYQQLKKNYDTRLDYWTANEFHIGEMEMKRLAGPTVGPLLGLQRWLHHRLSLAALYRYASDYGNSYVKPMLWLLGALVLFAALLPLPGVGLKRQGSRQAETYSSVWDFQKNYVENLWPEVRLVGKGAITSVDSATFQKSAEYVPAYPWGRVLTIFETLLTSSLFALFLLAIRRQFRR